jgi:cell division protein ZapA (FtsZ GTPase activity inhibitor)
MRKDGRFVGVDGSIPEGQGIIMAHLNECHELVEMVSFIRSSTTYAHLANQLKESMEGDEEDEDEDEETATDDDAR